VNALALAAALLSVTGRRTIPPSAFVPAAPAAARAVPLALVVEEGSGWAAPGKLEAVLGKASAILGACGVSLGAAEVVTGRWSPEALRALNEQNPYKGPAQIAVMVEPLLPARRPLGFLFAPGSVPSTASAYNASSVSNLSRSYPQARSLLDTFWITFDHESRRRPRDESPSYSVAAHELVHLLGDLGHTLDRPNLMTDSDEPGAKSGDLNAAQCAAIVARLSAPPAPAAEAP
jgi:hypothetical protein